MLSNRCIRGVFTLLVVLSAPLGAQTIRGTVRDDSTAEPVAGANVMLFDTLGQGVTQAVADSEGRFRLQVEPGIYSFQVRRIGYAPTVTTSFEVLGREEAANVTIRVPLSSALTSDEPYRLTPLVVHESRVPRHLQLCHRHRETGLGEFVLREEFESWQPRTVADIVRRIPGFMVSGSAIDVHSRLHTRGTCPPLVFLDGLLVGNASTWNVNNLSVDAVGAVEAYTRAVQVPPEYQVDFVTSPDVEYHVNCGVIAFWSRVGDVSNGGSPVEVGLRYGGNVAGSGFGVGRLGVHLVTALAGPAEFYAAAYLKSKFLAGDENQDNSGWVAQLAVRMPIAEEHLPVYVGTGLILKRSSSLYTLGTRDGYVDPGNTIFAGLTFELGPTRPFIEMHVLDLWAFSGLNAQLITGAGVQF
jgi:hypothetical protein